MSHTGRRWTDAVAQWAAEGGTGRIGRGTPGYDEVAAIYRSWYPDWAPPASARKRRLRKEERVDRLVHQLAKLGVHPTAPEQKMDEPEPEPMPAPRRQRAPAPRIQRARARGGDLSLANQQPEVIAQIGSPPGVTDATAGEVAEVDELEQAIRGSGLSGGQLAELIQRLQY